ncbi:hypothetical protein ACFSKU_01130 [Pontibacter silvestris]|uniref:Uncharacterized protein n=2 Tax=Pontibacter silvestris TaxID=2305183 RepID=A0ABW4WRS2_9BACT
MSLVLIWTWIRTKIYTIDNQGNGSYNLHGYSSEYDKDNLCQFTNNNDCLFKEGDKVCNPSSERADKYALLWNGAEIHFQSGGA